MSITLGFAGNTTGRTKVAMTEEQVLKDCRRRFSAIFTYIRKGN
jgi:hypothetical protein